MCVCHSLQLTVKMLSAHFVYTIVDHLIGLHTMVDQLIRLHNGGCKQIFIPVSFFFSGVLSTILYHDLWPV